MKIILSLITNEPYIFSTALWIIVWFTHICDPAPRVKIQSLRGMYNDLGFLRCEAAQLLSIQKYRETLYYY